MSNMTMHLLVIDRQPRHAPPGTTPCACCPAYQLERDSAAGTLTLIVNLISRHAVPPAGVALTRPRKLVFGLMVSPAKPQPVRWTSRSSVSCAVHRSIG